MNLCWRRLCTRPYAQINIKVNEFGCCRAVACSSLAAPPLSGTSVIVTGGGSGIGQGIALRLAAEGANVVITGRRATALQETMDEAADLAGSISPFVTDINERDQSDLVAHAVKQNGKLDILVNNAGCNIPQRSLSELSIEDWHKVVDTNLNGTFHVLHAALPVMRDQNDGLIINITSISGKRTISELAGAAYCASKFAVGSLGNAINLEEHQHGIRCTNIAPGEGESEILASTNTLAGPLF